MIAIRADANQTIATGHVMRCIAIASQLKMKGSEVLFIIADTYPVRILEDKGFAYVVLNTNWQDKESELLAIAEVIVHHQIDTMLVDSYEVTYEYLKHLKALVKVMYIDDLNLMDYPVDIVVNYSLDADLSIYSQNRQTGKFLLGADFVPLRSEFNRNPINVNSKVEQILITTGGSDPFYFVERLLNEIITGTKLNDCTFNVVVGQFYQNVDSLKILAGQYSNVRLHEQVTQMADLMSTCDLAVSAGGTTLAELATLGIPTIAFTMADNQIKGVKAFETLAGVIYVGDIRENMNDTISSTVTHLIKLCEETNLRQVLSEKQRACIDGQGAKRIACELEATHGQVLSYGEMESSEANVEKVDILLDSFRALYQKMAFLNRLEMEKALSGYSSSEVHCMEYVGRHTDVNVTKLAQAFYMTRGAMSKVTKKLIEKKVLESYQKEDNRKEVYFRLTAKGLEVFELHEALHQQFVSRDAAFFDQLSEEQVKATLSFIANYSAHLDSEIKKRPELQQDDAYSTVMK